MYKTTAIDDQQKMALPLNRDTEKIWYGLRACIDAKVKTEPRTWQVSKVNRLAPNGMITLTFKQDFFNDHLDYIETDDHGNVVAMWADYYKSGVEVAEQPTNEPVVNEYAVISYSGAQKPQLKINGNYKTFTVTFYTDIGDVEHKDGNWGFTIDGEDVASLVSVSTDGLNENQIKLKFIGDDSYIGKDLVVSYESLLYDNRIIRSEVTMNLIGI